MVHENYNVEALVIVTHDGELTHSYQLNHFWCTSFKSGLRRAGTTIYPAEFIQEN